MTEYVPKRNRSFVSSGSIRWDNPGAPEDLVCFVLQK